MKPKTHRSTTSLTHSWTNSNVQFNKSLFLKVPIARTPSFCSLPYCPIQSHCLSYYGHKKLCHKRGSTSNPKGPRFEGSGHGTRPYEYIKRATRWWRPSVSIQEMEQMIDRSRIPSQGERVESSGWKINSLDWMRKQKKKTCIAENQKS